MLIALAIGFCAACRSASALLSVPAGVASGPVQFNVRTLISMIITIHPSNAIVPMTRTAASQRNLTSGMGSWLAGSERGMGADAGEWVARLAGRRAITGTVGCRCRLQCRGLVGGHRTHGHSLVSRSPLAITCDLVHWNGATTGLLACGYMVSNAGCARITQSNATRRICDQPQVLVALPRPVALRAAVRCCPMHCKRDASQANRNHWDSGQSHPCFTRSSGRCR